MMCIILPLLTAIEAFDATSQRYLDKKKNQSPLPPKYINGISQNDTKQGLIICSPGFLQMYFMLGFHLVCGSNYNYRDWLDKCT